MKQTHSYPGRTHFLFLFILCLFLGTGMRAQVVTGGTPNPPVTRDHCASKILLDRMDPARLQSFEQSIYSRAMERVGRMSVDTDHYVLPVVFHILHENGPENISDADLQDAIVLLNTAFRHQAPYNPANGVNIDIEFCMAPTAVTRRVSPLTNVIVENDDIAVKQLDQWDPTTYINIWVVSSIGSLTMGPGVAGYATMPGAHGLPDDGIVIESSYLHNDAADVAVLIHEMGHYLGLYHTFEGGCGNTDCMINGDRVCDTPPDNSTAPVPCSSSANTCHSDSDDPSINNPFRATSLGGLGDQPDMIQNFMDYGFQTCQNTFTDGQRTRMRDALRDSRHSLLEHPGLCVGCPSPIIASLVIADTLQAGVPVTFTLNTATTGLLLVWQFSNGFSNAVFSNTYTQTFPTAGTVYLDLYVFSTISSACSFHIYDTIVFTCPVPVPVLTANPAGFTSPGQTVTFTTPDNGDTYTWYVDGTASGTGATFNYTAGNFGQQITLDAGNGTCKTSGGSYFSDPVNCANDKTNNTWYFGESAGINFNVSPPQAITGKVVSTEGSAVFCDASGNALYHSNGTSVENSITDYTLLNGSGLTGNPTTTQPALFVPMPGDNRYVYLFTLDFQAGDYSSFGGGLYYSVIDKLGDSGQGEVTLKNQLLLAPATEKLTAIRNKAGDAIWIIAHQYFSDAFYAWKITSTGISTPVISHTGSIHENAPGVLSYYNTIGEMKVSPSGKKIALAMAGQNKVEIFDFNNVSGSVTNPVSISTSHTYKSYGIAFSPNERFLFNTAVAYPYELWRYDLDAVSAAAITASGTLVGSSGGGLQLAPDGKIYAARGGSNYLGVINNPNSITVAGCNYVESGFHLANGTLSELGLVNPIQSALLTANPSINGPATVCLTGPPQTINYTIDPFGTAAYSWTHHGPGAYTFLNDSSITITFSATGNDTLIVHRTASCGILSDTLIIHSGSPSPFSLGVDVTVCKGMNMPVNAGPGMVSYSWNTGGTSQTTFITAPGKAVATVVNTAGCVMIDSMMVNVYTLPSLELGNDTSICASETLTLHAPLGMTSYLWSTGTTTNSLFVNDSGRYIVTVGKFGCLFKDTIYVQKNLPLNMFTNDSIMICAGSSHVITADPGFATYSWQLPSGAVTSSPSVTLAAEGNYILTYSNHCGTGKDTIYNYIPHIFPQDTLFTCADTLHLISSLHLTSFIYVDVDHFGNTQSGDTLDIFRSGYFIGSTEYPTVGSGCILFQTFTVFVDSTEVRPSKTIDLGPDASFCEGYVLPLNAGAGFDSYHWNTGSIDSATTVYGFGQYTVTAKYCGFNYSDTIVITNDNSVTVNLGADVSSCNPAAEVLDAGSGYDWYAWSTGATTQQINGSGFGEYSVSTGLNGCVARDTIRIIDCATSVPQKADDCTQPFYLSPNPGTDAVTLGSRCSPTNTLRVAISSSNGKMIAAKEGNLNTINVFMNQLMQGLSPAVYIVQVTNETGRYYFKWMIIK